MCLRSIVFLDIGTDDQKIGRIILELKNEIVPKSAENFRALCTGEKGIGSKGKPLHYKNSFFHRTVPEFMIQGGDITNKDGTGGESIYGPFFEDENFEISHSHKGVLSMANTGQPNSNNSQFFITVAPSTHLDGKNVAIGSVLRGLDIVKEISETEAVNDRPFVHYKIIDCGEIKAGENYGIEECDGTSDVYPPYPSDWALENPKEIEVVQEHWARENSKDIELLKMKRIVTNIKNSGNTYYEQRRFHISRRKYQKALNYIEMFTTKPYTCNADSFKNLKIICLLNLAAVLLKEQRYKESIVACDQVLAIDKNNVKATFRKGQANAGLSNFEMGLKLLYDAQLLLPTDQRIVSEIRAVKRRMNDYLNSEKKKYFGMFNKISMN